METSYKPEELIEASERFGYSRWLVAAALKMSGKTEYTLAEAEQTIREFAESEVE